MFNFSTWSSLQHLSQPLHHDPSAFCRVILGGKRAQAGIERDRSGLVENTVPFDIRKFRKFKWNAPNVSWETCARHECHLVPRAHLSFGHDQHHASSFCWRLLKLTCLSSVPGRDWLLGRSQVTEVDCCLSSKSDLIRSSPRLRRCRFRIHLIWTRSLSNATRYAASQNLYKSRVTTNTGKQTIFYIASIFWRNITSYLKSLNWRVPIFWTARKFHELTSDLTPSNIHCSYGSIGLSPCVFIPYLLVSFNPVILFCFARKRQGITRNGFSRIWRTVYDNAQLVGPYLTAVYWPTVSLREPYSVHSYSYYISEASKLFVTLWTEDVRRWYASDICR